MTRPRVLTSGYKLTAVTELTEHPRNQRRGNLEAVTESIRANGFYGTVVAQKSTGYVLVGNHRLRAAAAAGLAKVPVVWADVDDERALRILLVDNRSNDVASYDESGLADLLQDLVDTDDGLQGTGFDEDALEDLIAKLTPADDPSDTDPDESSKPDIYGVSVACGSEDDQEQLIARLSEWGYEPRKMNGDWAARRGRGA